MKDPTLWDSLCELLPVVFVAAVILACIGLLHILSMF